MMYPSAGGKKPWLLIVDEATDYTLSFFLEKKSDMIEIMLIWIKNLFKKYHIRIKKSRLCWKTVEKTECYKLKLINET